MAPWRAKRHRSSRPHVVQRRVFDRSLLDQTANRLRGDVRYAKLQSHFRESAARATDNATASRSTKPVTRPSAVVGTKG
jgi:hypothetical protein